MTRHKFLRSILFLSIVAVLILPLHTVFFVYPSFTKLLIENTEKEAVSIARHIASMLITGKDRLDREAFTGDFKENMEHLQKEFGLMKVKIFSPSGEIIYSSDPGEIGDINTESYFYNIVAKGNAYTSIVKKDSRSLEGQVVAADVVETYIPIMRDRFIGAFEIYFDITKDREKLNALILRSSITLFAMAVSLLIAVIVSSYRASRAVSEHRKVEDALRESEETLRIITCTAKDAIIMMDNDGNISYWNPAAENIFGYTKEEAIGKELHIFLGPERYHEAYRAGFKKFRETGEGPVIGKTIELMAIRKDKTEFPIELSLSAMQVKGRWHATGIIRDITGRKHAEEELKKHREQLEEMIEERTVELRNEIAERKHAEDALRRSEKFLSTIFDSIRDPFSIIDRDYRIIRANEAYAQMRSKEIKDLIGRRCYEVLQNRGSVCEGCVVEKTFRSADPCAKEKFMTFNAGTEIGVEIYTYPIFNEEGSVSYVIEYTRDITDRKKAEEERKRLIEKLEYLSSTDSLTGLLNRRALINRLEYEMDRAKRYGAELALILCDMDNFKNVNDTYGHIAGDRVLQTVSEALNSALRLTDIAGRYGGDEFMVILPETTLQGAENLAERIRVLTDEIEFLLPDGKPARISLSLGITCFNPAETLDAFVKRADSAMYAAKKAGGNRVCAVS